MPELPEVETVVNHLVENITGKTILSLSSPNNYHKVFSGKSIGECNRFIQHQSIEKIYRRGKYILLSLSKGFISIHLRMTGKLLVNLHNSSELKYVSAQFHFDDDTSLHFMDVRKFGRIICSENLDYLENKLGIEPLSQHFTPHWLQSQLPTKNRQMKPLLLDQSFIVGLGNIYVDEALWLAEIHPNSISSNITQKNCEKLCKVIKQILLNAIQLNGTSFQSFSYGNNSLGSYIDKLNIFGKNGLPCPRCHTLIQKIKVAQRGTHFCPKCQRL